MPRIGIKRSLFEEAPDKFAIDDCVRYVDLIRCLISADNGC